MNARDIQADLIDVELLPSSLQELSEVIGLDATLKLAATFPSVPLYVPSVAKPDHRIAGIIGFANYQHLVEYYGGDTITLAKVDAATRQIKRHMHKSLRSQGKSNRDIALELNYSQRHVERLNQSLRDEDQIDLFER
ncbi:MAG: hypothetical protein K6L74_16840 [Neptuniibacter sp.]